jgi:hypothetical protein
MPSAFSTSSAYSASRKLPSVSGKGIDAKNPKRVGFPLTIRAAYSLHSRDSVRAAWATPNQTPGVVIESRAVATPRLSISSSAFCGVHSETIVLSR